MDEIDHNLIEAWDRIVARCNADPAFAARRERLAQRDILMQPLRAWCLAIRASDTRINDYRFFIMPREAVSCHEDHEVTLEGESIRHLTAPVRNPWPGMRAKHAAEKLGICFEVMMRWAKTGRNGVKLKHYRPGNDGWWGPMSPWVWWESPLDPGHMEGSPPDAVWGSLWQSLGERMPDGFHQVVHRLPRWREDPRYGLVFCGWDWKCPGIVDANGKWRDCGRRCRWLYAAVPVVRVQDFLGESAGIALPKQVGLESHVMRFACQQCVDWSGMQDSQRGPAYAWNKFVRHISGGLLFGSEVKRPAGLGVWKRKKLHTARRRASAED